MIALDLDGTTLSPKGIVTPRTRAAIQSVLAAGADLCFATGRNWNESRAIFESAGHLDWAIVVGGAVVMNADGRIAVRRAMEPTLAAEVAGTIESLGQAAMALQDHENSDVDYLISAGSGPSAESTRWMNWTKTTWRPAADLASRRHDHTLRISLVAEPSVTARALERLTETFGDRIVFHCIAVPGQSVEVLEVFDPRVNKWSALLEVAREKGIDPREIVAVGDDLNDLPMLRHAGLGVAMGNAHPEAKKAAKRVIGSNDADGLAVFLESLVADNQIAQKRVA